MPFYNQYYTRGYAARYENGKYKEPLAHNAGYCTVGASENLERYYADNLEGLCSSLGFPILNEDVKSLYLIPNAIGNKSVLGQCRNSKNGNFLDSRSNHFIHNIIMDSSDLNDIIYDSDNHKYLFSAKLKDTYVDKDLPNKNELSYKSAITPSYDRIADIIPDCDASLNIADRLERYKIVPEYSMSREAAYSIVYHMLKTSKYIIMEVSQDIQKVDSIARGILSMLYRWIPLRCLERTGFISCLNINDPPKECRLLFCSSEISRYIKISGLKNIPSSELVFISCIDNSNVAEVNESSLYENEKKYINILAKCISGDVTDYDITARVELLDIEISHRSLKYSIEYIARLFNIIYKKQEAIYSPEAAKGVFESTFCLYNDCYLEMPEYTNILQKHNFFGNEIMTKGCTEEFLKHSLKNHYNALMSFCNVTNSYVQGQIDNLWLNLSKISQCNDYKILEKCKKYLKLAYDRYNKNEYDRVREYSCGIVIVFKAYNAHHSNYEVRSLMGKLINAMSESAGEDTLYRELNNSFIYIMLFRLLQKENLAKDDCKYIMDKTGTGISKLISELAVTVNDYLRGKKHIYKDDVKKILKYFFLYLSDLNSKDESYLKNMRDFYVDVIKENGSELNEFTDDIRLAVNTSLVKSVCVYPKQKDRLSENLKYLYDIKDAYPAGEYDRFISKIIAILACMNYRFDETAEFRQAVNDMFKTQIYVIAKVMKEGYIYNLLKDECSIPSNLTSGHDFNSISSKMKCTNFVNTLEPYVYTNTYYKNWRQTSDIRPYPNYVSESLSENILLAFEENEDRLESINMIVNKFNEQADFTRLFVISDTANNSYMRQYRFSGFWGNSNISSQNNEFKRIINVLNDREYQYFDLHKELIKAINEKIRTIANASNQSLVENADRYFMCMFNIVYFKLSEKNTDLIYTGKFEAANSFMNNPIFMTTYDSLHNTVSAILMACNNIYTEQSIDQSSRDNFINAAANSLINIDESLCKSHFDTSQYLLCDSNASKLFPKINAMAEASKQPDTHYNQLLNGSVNNFNNSSKAHQTINNPILNTPTEQKTAKKTPKKIGLKIFILFAAVILLVAAALIAIYLNMEPHDTQVSESDHISSSDKQDELQSFIIKTVSGTDFVDISNHIYVDKDNSIYVELSDLKSYLGLDSSDNLLYETLYLDVYDNEYDCRINQENCLAKYMGAEKLNKRYKFLLDVDYVLEEDFKFKTDTTYFFRFYTDSINDVSLKYELDLV